MKIKSLKGIKVPTNTELLKRLQRFESEYTRQKNIIITKIELSSGENKNRLLEFKKDMDKFKEMSDNMKKVLEGKGIRGHLNKAKFIMVTSKKYLLFTIKITRKYKKEDCDIDNFKT